MGDFGAWQKREFSVFYDALASLRREWKSVGLSSKHCFSKGFEILPDLLEKFSSQNVFESKILRSRKPTLEDRIKSNYTY